MINYKYFKDGDYEIKPFRIMLPKTSAYVTSYNGETKWMIFLFDDNDLLKKYNDISNKVSNSIEKKLNCKNIFFKKLLKKE